MAITVIGGTGYAGSAIVKEASARGHEVTSVSRNAPSSPIEGVAYVTSPVSATGSLDGADVVVATLSPRGDNVGALPGLYRKLAKATAAVDARFVVIGGFGSLRPTSDAPRFADGDDLPPEFAVESREMNSILLELLDDNTDLNWVFVSPGAEFGSHAPGEDLGRYRTSADIALFDEDGTSAISGADFARAIINEIETPTIGRGQIHFAY